MAKYFENNWKSRVFIYLPYKYKGERQDEPLFKTNAGTKEKELQLYDLAYRLLLWYTTKNCYAKSKSCNFFLSRVPRLVLKSGISSSPLPFIIKVTNFHFVVTKIFIYSKILSPLSSKFRLVWPENVKISATNGGSAAVFSVLGVNTINSEKFV